MINNKIYIGKTEKNIDERLINHFNKAKSGKSKMLISKAILKYGFENFKIEVIEKCLDISSLNQREIYWIKEFNSINKLIGYNCTLGGTGGDTYTNNPNYDLICEKHKIIMLNESSEMKEKRTKKLKGLIRKKSTCKAISKARKGMMFTETHKNNISIKTKEAMRSLNIYNIKPVDCYDLDNNYVKTFKSLAEASRELNIGKMSIFKNCNGKRNKAGNFIFKYSNDI